MRGAGVVPQRAEGWRNGGSSPLKGTWAGEARELLRRVLELADECGVSRKMVARRMGVSIETIELWVLPMRLGVIPAGQLLRLLGDAAVLPFPARKMLGEELARLAKLDVVGVGAGDVDDAGAAVVQVCEIQGALGKLAMHAAEAMAAGGEGGAEVTAAEAAVLLPLVEKVVTEANELRQGLREKVTGGKNFPP